MGEAEKRSCWLGRRTQDWVLRAPEHVTTHSWRGVRNRDPQAWPARERLKSRNRLIYRCPSTKQTFSGRRKVLSYGQKRKRESIWGAYKGLNESRNLGWTGEKLCQKKVGRPTIEDNILMEILSSELWQTWLVDHHRFILPLASWGHISQPLHPWHVEGLCDQFLPIECEQKTFVKTQVSQRAKNHMYLGRVLFTSCQLLRG